MYGHIKQLAEAEKKGIEAAGGTADIFQYGQAPSIRTVKPFPEY